MINAWIFVVVAVIWAKVIKWTKTKGLFNDGLTSKIDEILNSSINDITDSDYGIDEYTPKTKQVGSFEYVIVRSIFNKLDDKLNHNFGVIFVYINTEIGVKIYDVRVDENTVDSRKIVKQFKYKY